MNRAGPAIQNLARRLIALEAASSASDVLIGGTVRACEKLRIPLSKFVGVAGFRSLMGRAYLLALEEFPCLDAVQIRPDGSLEGFGVVTNDQDGVGTEIVAQLLGLLIAFVGEHFTMCLVRDAWPEAIF